MSATMTAVEEIVNTEDDNAGEASNIIPLSQFIDEFGEGLLAAVQQQNPPVYDGVLNPERDAVMRSLRRQPFPAQAEVVQAASALLIDEGESAAVIGVLWKNPQI